MPIPDYQTLMLPVLRLAALGEKRVGDVESLLADQFQLTQAEREQLLPSGRQAVLHNRIHWAKFYLMKAGLLEFPRRGCFVATEAGRHLLTDAPDRLTLKHLLHYSSFREFYRGGAPTDGTADVERGEAVEEETQETPEERVEAAHEAVLAALRSDVLARILQNSPTFFERAIVDLLVKMGYGGSFQDAAARLTPRTGDGGIDGVINEDRLGLDRLYVQAKRYAPGNTVSRPEVQAFVGSLVGLGASKGVFVTTSTFSKGAEDYVRHLPQRVILIDGSRLAELMIEHDVGVKISRTISFKRIDEDFFAEEE